MKKKRQICIFAVAFVMAAVQGTVFAGTRDVESSVEGIDVITADTTESNQILEEKAFQMKQITEQNQKETGAKKSSTKQEQKSVKKTADGQTLLNVSQGNITIKSTGASGGGYKQ